MTNRSTEVSGPGRSYRKGLSLIQVTQRFSTPAKAEAWFVRQRWPNGIQCPECDSDNVAKVKSRKPQPYRCRTCKKQFSVKTGTVLQNSKIPLHKWAIAFYLYSTNLKGVSSMKLHRDLGITQKSAWHMAHRIREALSPADAKFAGPVEVDETYFGGKDRNRPKHLRGGRRGPKGKVAVVGMRDRSSGQVTGQVVARTDAATLQAFVRKHTAPDAMVYTDEATAYSNMRRRHETVNHSVSEFVRQQAHTNGMESHWAALKRGYHGVYHHMSAKHLQRYIGEFAGRHNSRPMDTADQMNALARNSDGKQLTYAELTE